MNIKELHTEEKAVSAVSVFKNECGFANAMQILKGEKLKEHVSKVPALLMCVVGEAIYGNERGIEETLRPGDYVHIQAMVTHWVFGVTDTQLILIK